MKNKVIVTRGQSEGSGARGGSTTEQPTWISTQVWWLLGSINVEHSALKPMFCTPIQCLKVYLGYSTTYWFNKSVSNTLKQNFLKYKKYVYKIRACGVYWIVESFKMSPHMICIEGTTFPLLWPLKVIGHSKGQVVPSKHVSCGGSN